MSFKAAIAKQAGGNPFVAAVSSELDMFMRHGELLQFILCEESQMLAREPSLCCGVVEDGDAVDEALPAVAPVNIDEEAEM